MKPEEETKRGQTRAHTGRHFQWCWKIKDTCEVILILSLGTQKNDQIVYHMIFVNGDACVV